jgi:plastocyanin
MVKKLLFILLFTLSITANAQVDTVTINWSFGSTPNASGDANASRTIEVGDTVIWNWYSTGNHNVKSNSNANQTFESNYFGNGGSFSQTFTSVGVSDYVCTPHPSSMYGTITVVANGSLSVASFETLGTIDMYPNPAKALLTIAFEIQDVEKLNIQVYNLLGKEVLSKQISKEDTSLIVSGLNNGIYVVKITSLNGKNSTTKRFVKI